MKKILSMLTAGIFVLSAVSADYNPPVMGENFYELSSPRQLSNANSSTGGGIFYEGPDSILVNPALTAGEQRVVLNLANTELFASGNYGDAFQLGITIPFKWAVLTGYANGVFSNSDAMKVGNSFNIKGALSKQISDRLSLGMSLNVGVFGGSGYEDSWDLFANLGGLYSVGDVGFLKDVRFGVAVSNLGKPFSKTELPGIRTATRVVTIPNEDPESEEPPVTREETYIPNAGAFPQIGTLQIGAGALLLSTEYVKIGASLDFTTPLFQNFIMDAGLQFSIKDMLFVSVAEKLNIAEIANGHKDFMPSFGISFKFDFSTSLDYAQRHGWNQSEMTITGAYKNFYNSVHGASEGVDLYLGMPDKEAPVINIIFEEEGAE
ncbi:MAG: hypothetical protein K6A43_00305 [Treponema sp.]|nr:hypothetical protein [Treponema sp.]